MRIPLHLIFQRQVGTCPSGQLYYNCAVSGFIGCCSIDPCVSGCPAGSGSANGSSSSSAVASSTTSAPASISTAPGPVSTSSQSQSVTGSPSSTANSPPSKTTTSRSGISQTTLGTSTTSQPASSSATTAPSPSSSSSTPIGLIAGMVVLGLIILILIIVLFFYRRRRNSTAHARKSPPKRFSNFFSRMSLTSPLLASKTGPSSDPDSPDSATKSPVPLPYTDEKATPVLDSNPIHELPITTRRGPVELPASTPAPATRYNPTHQHVTSYSEAGAERDEVGALIGNLAAKDRLGRRSVPKERESWASGATGASTEAVVGGDALGIRNH